MSALLIVNHSRVELLSDGMCDNQIVNATGAS